MTPRSSSPELLASGSALSPAAQFRDLMACWPTGVAVVTGGVPRRPVGCTVTAVAAVSTSPPLLLVSLAARSRTLGVIERGGRFGVCVLSTGMGHLARSFATGEPSGRFAGVAVAWVLGVPILHGVLAGAVCEVRARLPVADHVLVTGEPVWQIQDDSSLPAVWFQRDLCGLSLPVREASRDR